LSSDLVGWIRTASLGVALATLMMTSHNSIREEIRAESASLRTELAAIREDIHVLIERTVRNETRIEKLESQ